MLSVRLLRLALLALLALLLVPAAAVKAAPKMPIGFYDDPSFRWAPEKVIPQNLQAAKQAHASLIHALADWRQIAPDKPKNPLDGDDPAYNLSDLDALVQTAPLVRIVHDRIDSKNRSRARTVDAELLALPEHGAFAVDDAGRIEHRPGVEPVTQGTREAERDERPLRNAVHRAEPDQRCAGTGTPADAKLSRSGAGKCHPVSVHTVLRTVSFRLLAASKAADGSKPEWIAQCSQRSSLPGPYSSHSIPSSSAS